MKKFKVVWEVSKEAIVKAESKEDAIGMVLDGVVDGVEVEMTLHPEALEEGEF